MERHRAGVKCGGGRLRPGQHFLQHIKGHQGGTQQYAEEYDRPVLERLAAPVFEHQQNLIGRPIQRDCNDDKVNGLQGASPHKFDTGMCPDLAGLPDCALMEIKTRMKERRLRLNAGVTAMTALITNTDETRRASVCPIVAMNCIRPRIVDIG